ncbi:hypothetical protein RB195_021147 [Necator americanus]|uniref:Uncharacterized protein n=1 Tax=Necator americanus TaxID=51031 RepID=A0ABR1E9M7_NECAM
MENDTATIKTSPALPRHEQAPPDPGWAEEVAELLAAEPLDAALLPLKEATSESDPDSILVVPSTGRAEVAVM